MDTWDWEVKSVLIHKFENLTQDNYHILRKHGSFKLPNNEPLFQIDEGELQNIKPTFPVPAHTLHHSPPNQTISAPAIQETKKK